MAFWPDWVLDHCKRIQELRGSGYSLKGAALKAHQERAEFLRKPLHEPLLNESSGKPRERRPTGDETLDSALVDRWAEKLRELMKARDVEGIVDLLKGTLDVWTRKLIHESLDTRERSQLHELVSQANEALFKFTDSEAEAEDMFTALVIQEYESVTVDPNQRAELIPQIQPDGDVPAYDLAMRCIHLGFNPILAFNGARARVLPDFIVSHCLGYLGGVSRAIVLIPLLPILHKARAMSGLDQVIDPIAYPARRYLKRESGGLVEFEFQRLDFEDLEAVVASSIQISSTLKQKRKTKREKN